jgi:hypothetical protein
MNCKSSGNRTLAIQENPVPREKKKAQKRKAQKEKKQPLKIQ